MRPQYQSCVALLVTSFIILMRFAILGHLEVTLDGRPIRLGGPKQRALLGFLLLHANTAVSRDRLIDAVMGEYPPPSASDSLDTYVYRLRKLIGPGRASACTRPNAAAAGLRHSHLSADRTRPARLRPLLPLYAASAL